MPDPMDVDHDGQSLTFLYSTGVNLTTFHPFPRLPQDLRARIFTLASPPARTHFLEVYAYSATFCDPRIRYIPRLPALFHATSESRKAIVDAQGGDLINLTTPQKDERWIWDRKTRRRVKIPSKLGYFYFNFNHDILFLGSRFLRNRPSNETYRLRQLENAISFCYLSRLKRIVVTYSGLDDYSEISGTLRWLDDLEVLYVAMQDKRSSMDVVRGLRKGYPRAGMVSAKILQVLSDAEGEETEDEEEDADSREERKMIRANRRVVEVDLRLDEQLERYDAE
jgi:hypothetical protein